MMVSRILKTSMLILFVTGLMIVPASAKNNEKNPGSKSLRKTMTNDVYHPMLINTIFNYYSNNGDGSFNNFSSTGEGFEFPKGDNLATVIFEDGVVWGCQQNGTLKVGGSTYWHGLQAGRIITNGTATTDPVADNADDPANRLFRVRPDLPPIAGVTNPDDPAAAGELAIVQNSEVALIGRYEVGITAEQILQQYWADWNEWPASYGAPFKDVNGDGIYDPSVDIPGVPQADQTMWYVANDLDASRVNTLSGSTPIGIEMQKTIWAYNLNGAMANTIFASTKIINKSGKELDSMYVAQWTDPDLGDANDDFCGCDTIRSLGYVYNGEASDANFATYNLVPPAAGFDFFQGPMIKTGVMTDTAIFGLKYRLGYKNLPMTSFNFFINGNNTYSDPPHGNYQGTVQWWNLLRGLVASTGAPYVNPITNAITPFVLSGDPVAGTGWIDGTIAGPGDRRMALCSGPFTMLAGDTQEVVVANIAGRGTDYLSSVTTLKAEDDFAQSIYNRLFVFPNPPSPPKLQVVYLDGKAVLNWGNPTSVAKTESQLNDNGYTFEGYNIWQCPKNSPDGAIRLATFDRSDDSVGVIHDWVYVPSLGDRVYEPVQFGNNTGLVHTYEIDKDAVNGGPLINDRNYYFAVTAYNFNPAPELLGASLENPVAPVAVVPQAVLPGIKYTQHYGDTLSVTHSSGISGGSVVATVIDVNALTGDTYKVTFDSSGLWYLTDMTKNDTLLSKAPQDAFGITSKQGYVVDGFQIASYGPPAGLKPGVQGSAISSSPDIGFQIVTGVRAFTWGGSGDPFGLEGFGGAIGAGADWAELLGGFTPLIPANALQDVLIELAATDTSGNPLNPSSDTVSMAYRYLRHASSAATQPSFAPFIINPTAGYAYQDRRPVPIRVYQWNIATGTRGNRLDIGFLENNIATGTVDGIYWPPLSSTMPGGYDGSVDPREWLYIFGTQYSATTANAALTVDILDDPTPMLYWCTANRNGNSWAGDSYILHPYHINLPADVFTFASVAPVFNTAQAKTDVAKINVFPNPYLGYNKLEPSSYTRFVTFTHLPQKATIRIYNLAGILVRTIIKNDAGQLENWNLQNEAGFPVASGMYIAYIDMPDIGMTKTLKLGIIQEQEFLKHF